MSELLDIAIKAHGGLNRWKQVNSIEVNASITGAIWAVKGRPDVLKDVVITAETKRERLLMDLTGQDKQTVFEPDRVLIRTVGGVTLADRHDPRDSFEGQTMETPWDDVDVAFFSGEALWTYLNVPFLYTQPGFEMEEIASIQVGGEKWRRLKVSFPDSVESHTKTQISCFGPDGLLRRHDYTVDILGGSKGLNYASNYKNVGGIIFPATRRVVGYQGDYEPIMEPALVAIDLKEFALH